MHKHFNGLKTTLLFGAIWALLLGIGSLVAGGRFIWVFALLGVATTFYGYWNSDKIAIKAMQAYPVTEAQQPAMYRIVLELSSKAGQPMPALFVSPTDAPNAFATGRNPRTLRSAAPRESCDSSTSASSAVCWGTNSCTSTTATSSPRPWRQRSPVSSPRLPR